MRDEGRQGFPPLAQEREGRREVGTIPLRLYIIDAVTRASLARNRKDAA
jgi:hypothetical protein